MNRSIINIKNFINEIMTKMDKNENHIHLVEEQLHHLLNLMNEKETITIPNTNENIDDRKSHTDTDDISSHMEDTNTPNKIMSHNNIMELKGLINNLNKEQQIEVFKIIYASGKYTENSNGIFINLTNMNNDILWKIQDLVGYFSNKNKYLIEEQEQRNIIMENVNIEKNKNIKVTTKDTISNIIEDELNINTHLSDIENKILNEEFNIYNELLLSNKKPSYEGIEARIVKKCKELNKPMESSSNLEE